MEINKAKKLLAKVNTLFQSMNSDEGSISPIEKDLMRSYLRELYEQFYDLSDNGAKSAPAAKASEPPEEDIEVIRVKKKDPPAPTPTPRIVEVPKMQEAKPEPPAPKPEPTPEPPAPTQKPQTPPPAGPEMDELFAQPEKPAKELSEKLSEMPVADLSKAMGLNERIFTINELFGGSQDSFDQAMSRLNSFSNFGEAESYLRELAGRYEWTHKNKIKKAKNFLKLVRRRYVKN